MDENSKEKLWDLYAKNKNPELREKIIIEYAPLVKLVAGRLSMYLGYNVEYEDLVSYGIFGLIDAIDKYDFNKNVKFETYASLRIRGAILDQIRKMDWIPRSVRQKQKKIESAMSKLETEYGRAATDEEIARELDISTEELDTMKKRLNYKDIARETVILTVAVAIIAAAVYFFLVPSHTSVSSISGLGIVLSNFVPLPLSAITMFLNVVLLIIGFFTCGREFGVKTVYTSVMLPLFLGFFELVFPDFGSMTDSQELDVLCYILVVSIGLSILFNRNASSGGLDIVAKIMNKYLHIELGRAMSLSGMCVALSAALAYDKKTVVLSILGTYFNGIILDHFIFDNNKKRRVCIITRKEEELRRFIVEDLHSGATIYEATGAYNFDKHNEIITIVDKSEYQKLMNFINKEDPRAFVTVYNVSDMRYQPKVWNKDGFQ